MFDTAVVAFDGETPDRCATIAFAGKNTSEEEVKPVHHFDLIVPDISPIEQELPRPMTPDVSAPAPLCSGVCSHFHKHELVLRLGIAFIALVIYILNKRGVRFGELQVLHGGGEGPLAGEDCRGRCLYQEIIKKARRFGLVLTPASAESQAPTWRYSTVLSREEQLEFETALAAVVDFKGADHWERVARALPCWGMTAEQAEHRHDDLVHDVSYILEGRAPFPFCLIDYSEEG